MKALAITTTLALALSAYAQNSDLDQKIKAEMLKTTQMPNGVQVRLAPQSSLDATLKKLTGNITLEFGKGQNIELQKKSTSGVIVGSGADGLVATSNTGETGKVVVAAPLAPETSITVTGRANTKISQTTQFCVLFVGKKVNGVLPIENVPNSGEVKCNKLNSPIRLSDEGTYYVEFNYSYMIVELKKLENKVITLREIVVPEYDKSINAFLFKDTTSEHEKYKAVYYSAINYVYTKGKQDPYQQLKTVEEAYTHFYSEFVKDTFFNMDRWGGREEKALYVKNYIGRGSDGSYFPVLPGVYEMRWFIDGSNDVTRGIVVE